MPTGRQRLVHEERDLLQDLLELPRWPHADPERDRLAELCAAGARRFARDLEDFFTGP